MLGLRWEENKVYLIDEGLVKSQWRLVDPENYDWAYYIDRKEGLESNDGRFFTSENEAKMHCEYQAEAKIKERIEFLKDLLWT